MATVILSYIVTPLIILILSAVLSLIPRLTSWRKRPTPKRIASALCTLVLCVCISSGICLLIARRPAIVCPTDLAPYMDSDRRDEVREDIKNPYHGRTLCFPTVIQVTPAD